MSIKEIDRAILRLRANDESIETPGCCRSAAEAMMKTAQAADKTPPFAKIAYLAWPKAQMSENTHYALIVSNPEEGNMVFNPCPTAGFPQYSGRIENAPGLIGKMEVTEEVM